MTLEIFAASLSLTTAICCLAVAAHVGDQHPWRAIFLFLLGLVNVWFFVKDAVPA